jgi:hypothetical protein
MVFYKRWCPASDGALRRDIYRGLENASLSGNLCIWSAANIASVAKLNLYTAITGRDGTVYEDIGQLFYILSPVF